MFPHPEHHTGGIVGYGVGYAVGGAVPDKPARQLRAKMSFCPTPIPAAMWFQLYQSVWTADFKRPRRKSQLYSLFDPSAPLYWMPMHWRQLLLVQVLESRPVPDATKALLAATQDCLHDSKVHTPETAWSLPKHVSTLAISLLHPA